MNKKKTARTGDAGSRYACGVVTGV